MHIEELRLGSYTTLAELASGGMGTVYLARQAGAGGFERLVVIKRVHRHLLKSREFCDMFRDEARLASLVRHPNVVSVDDVVEADGELFLVQPYVESLSFAELLARAKTAQKQVPAAIVARIVADALAGLSGAHEAKDLRGEPLHLVHRDVSPQNVLVGLDGRSRLIDFGIAKAASRQTVTSSGVLKGKLAYMAPEQFRRQPIDARTDVFAAGVVLYEALTGDRPFDGADEGDTLLAILVAEPPPPSTLAPDVPAALDAVVDKALARDRDDRYATANDFLDALEHAIRPASTRDVAAFVESLGGEELAERRRKVRELLDRTPVSAPSKGDTPAAASEASTRAEIKAPPAPSPRLWVIALVALLAGSAIALVAFRNDKPPAPVQAPLGIATTAAPEVTSAPSALASAIPTASAAASVSSAAPAKTTHAPAPSIAAAPTVKASAAPTATPTASSELHQNPYDKKP
jgi:serine/threonine-protein kinase